MSRLNFLVPSGMDNTISTLADFLIMRYNFLLRTCVKEQYWDLRLDVYGNAVLTLI